MYRTQNLARILLIYREISVSQHQETTLTVQNNRSRQGKLVCIMLYMPHVVSYRITTGSNGLGLFFRQKKYAYMTYSLGIESAD